MEDEEEIQSYQNGRPRSPSPSSSQPVTVAAAPPQHTLTLALPIQQPKPTGAGGGVAGTGGGGGSGGGGGREDCWSEGATSVLIDAWGERYLELSRGNLKQKHWKEVAEIVSGREDYTKPSKTDVQCKNRIDTLKKKYKQEKGKIASGQGPSKWPFFHRLDHLIGPNSKIATAATPPNPTTAAAAVASGNALATPMLLPGAKVPTAIPVGHRSLQKPQPQQPQQPQRMNLLKHQQLQQQQHQQQQQQQQRQQQQFRRSTESNSSRSGAAMGTPGSSDSFPPEPVNRKRGRIGKESRRRMRMKGNNNINNNWGNSIRELTSAILEFGEAYERAETSKLQEIVEMEKQRMGFAKELELQRMQFFMKTQLELTQLKQQQGKRGGGGGGNGHQNHHHQHGNNNRNNNSSD